MSIHLLLTLGVLVMTWSRDDDIPKWLSYVCIGVASAMLIIWAEVAVG